MPPLDRFCVAVQFVSSSSQATEPLTRWTFTATQGAHGDVATTARRSMNRAGPSSSQHVRVLHTITTFGTSSGAAENTRLTLERLPRDRFEIFLATRLGQSMQTKVPTDVKLLQLRHLVRPVRPFHDFWTLFELYRLCLRWRFDIVHTHNSKDGILGRLAARLAGVPVVIHTAHAIAFRASGYRLVNDLYEALERFAAPLADTLVAVSRENLRDSLSRRIGRPEQHAVVYSGLDLGRYQLPGVTSAKARSILGLPDASAWVGWFGRFSRRKDPLTFVRAAQIVLDGFPNVRFVVCGDDPLGENLWASVERLAIELGIRDRIHVLGFRNDLPLVMKAVDVVMHSSLSEGMGRIICEALACERPVAGTAVDGVREVIVTGERGGLLVPPGSPKELASATLALLRDPIRARHLAAAGRGWVETHLTVEKMVQDLVDVYESALLTKRPSPS